MPLEGTDWAYIAGIATDVAFCYLMHKVYKRGMRYYNEIQDAKQIELGAGLWRELSKSPDSTMGYVCVEGLAEPVGRPLKSRYGNQEGVIHSTSLTELKTKRVAANTWSDTKNVLRQSTEFIPFVLQSGKFGNHEVLVTEPKNAEYLIDDLTVTHDKIDQVNPGMLQRSFDFISGEMRKGFHEVESMLLVGTQLLGVGKLTLENGKVKLCPPDNGKKYVITKMSKEEILKKLSLRSFFGKLFFRLSVITGCCLVVMFAYRWYKKWMQRVQQEQLLNDIREARQRARQTVDARGDGEREHDDDDANLCIVCLNQRREVVLINCGHICLCLDCAEILPEPRMCPVCRSPVERFVPYYHS